jgi:hypothetical protein
MHCTRNVLTKMVLKNSLGDQGTCWPCASDCPKGPIFLPFGLRHLRAAALRQLPSTWLILLHNPDSKECEGLNHIALVM